MMIALDLCNGICWSCVYLLAVIQGIQKKTWCIPQVAACMNFSWEFWVVVSRVQRHENDSVAFLIQIAWLILDIGILATWLCFSPRHTKYRIKQVVLFIFAFLIFGYSVYFFDTWRVSAFSINLLMSGLFLYRLRGDDRTWVVWSIAPLKLVGTLAATVLNGIVYGNTIILWIGGLCFILDCYYWILISKESGKTKCLFKMLN